MLCDHQEVLDYVFDHAVATLGQFARFVDEEVFLYRLGEGGKVLMGVICGMSERCLCLRLLPILVHFRTWGRL